MTSPLSALNVLDFTTLLPGPYATMLLADWGASVLRIESPDRPDMARTVPPFSGHTSTTHGYLNRSKRSMTLDLKHPQAHAIIERLITKRYDIVVEGFRPGVMKRLGLDWQSLAKINPQLIYCSISGYGQTGPWAQKAGHDINYLAVSGSSSYTGRKKNGPMPLGIQVADIAGGSLHAVGAILAAVIQRQSTGCGQHLDISIADCALALNGIAGAAYIAGQKEPDYESEPLNGASIYDYYQTADQRYLAFGGLEPKFVSAFFKAIDRMDLLAAMTKAHASEVSMVKAEIQRTIASKTLQEWQEVFSGTDACTEPVLRLSEVRQHPHFTDRQMFVIVADPHFAQDQEQIANPVKFSTHTPEYRHIGCPAGSHNQEALAEVGYSEQEVSTLMQSGVLGPQSASGSER